MANNKTKIIKTTFKLRRDLAANWQELNPVLLDGEPGFEIDTLKLKIGNGILSWNELTYISEKGMSELKKGDGEYSYILNDYINSQANGDYSFAIGKSTIVQGKGGFAEGNETLSQGNYSHAEGEFTSAVGYSSHSEGRSTIAEENYSHAEGSLTEARGEASHAEGYGTVASRIGSHAEGQYNVIDEAHNCIHIVGNGKMVEEDGEINIFRSNAHTIDKDGNAWFSGDIYINSTSGINKDEGSKKIATEDFVNDKFGAVENAIEIIIEKGRSAL